MGWSSEFKVGLFVLISGAIITIGGIWSVDGVWQGEEQYQLHLAVASADGLWNGTPVRLAGVDIGSLEDPLVVGDHAELILNVREAYQLPVDSTAELRSSGLLGDRYVSIVLGSKSTFLQDEDRIELLNEPADFEKITQQVDSITEDLQAITKVLRKMAEDDSNRENVQATLANVEALSEELRQLAAQNHGDINAIVDSVGRLTKSLEGFTTDARANLAEEMDKLKEGTDSLNRTMDGIESVTGKIDKGEGTIGALVNDRETVDLLNDTIDNANQVVKGFSGLHSEVYWIGRYYGGTEPNDREAFFDGNPLASTGGNTVGIELHPQEDFWWTFEINDYPTGTVTYYEHYFPDSGESYTEYVREPNYRMTFMMNKRWFNFGLRLGVKETGGGFGFSYWLLKNHLELQADLFDFDLASYPAVKSSGIPNMRMNARFNVLDHVFFELGAEQMLLGLRYDYFTGFVGGGFHFTDDDIKLLFATLPLNF